MINGSPNDKINYESIQKESFSHVHLRIIIIKNYILTEPLLICVLSFNYRVNKLDILLCHHSLNQIKTNPSSHHTCLYAYGGNSTVYELALN